MSADRRAILDGIVVGLTCSVLGLVAGAGVVRLAGLFPW